MRPRLLAATVLAALTGAVLPVVPAAAADVPLPRDDPFYRYTAATPLAQVPRGTVLKTRTVTLAADVNETPLPATQLLYRTQDEVGTPTATVTTVVTPPGSTLAPKVIAYLSFYDSLSDKCDPSYTLRGGDPGAPNQQLSDAEQAFVQAYAATGNVVTVPDFEGPGLHWTAGHEAGWSTLDSVRATLSWLKAPASTMVGLTGYSGGSIAADWAAELAPAYAPELNIVGVAAGGVPVHFFHNLQYVNGSAEWSGIIPAVLTALTRAYGLDLGEYLNDYGKQLVAKDSSGCIGDFNGTHPGLKIEQMLKPEYSDVQSIAPFVDVINKLIMGTAPGRPKPPMLLVVGNNGSSVGDDIMVTKDVEALAHQYCSQGVEVEYRELQGLAHTEAGAAFEPPAIAFLQARFAGVPMVSNCDSVGTGNSLAPVALHRRVTPSGTPARPGTSSAGGSGTGLPSTGGAPLVGVAALLLLVAAGAYRRVTA